MMRLDRMKLGRTAKELGFVRDTLEKVCRLADVLRYFESDEILANALKMYSILQCDWCGKATCEA